MTTKRRFLSSAAQKKKHPDKVPNAPKEDGIRGVRVSVIFRILRHGCSDIMCVIVYTVEAITCLNQKNTLHKWPTSSL